MLKKLHSKTNLGDFHKHRLVTQESGPHSITQSPYYHNSTLAQSSWERMCTGENSPTVTITFR
jgi:hypothetical protein